MRSVPFDKDKAKQLYLSGMSIHRVAEAMGLRSANSLHKLIMGSGLSRNQGRPKGSSNGSRLDPVVLAIFRSLYEDVGLSLLQISKRTGMSPTAINFRLRKSGAILRKKKLKKDVNFVNPGSYRYRTGIDHYAQKHLNKAVKRGEVVPLQCSVCSTQPFENGKRVVMAHHFDYSKPLEVRWLCRKCHGKWHKENGPGINKPEAVHA